MKYIVRLLIVVLFAALFVPLLVGKLVNSQLHSWVDSHNQYTLLASLSDTPAVVIKDYQQGWFHSTATLSYAAINNTLINIQPDPSLRGIMHSEDSGIEVHLRITHGPLLWGIANSWWGLFALEGGVDYQQLAFTEPDSPTPTNPPTNTEILHVSGHSPFFADTILQLTPPDNQPQAIHEPNAFSIRWKELSGTIIIPHNAQRIDLTLRLGNMLIDIHDTLHINQQPSTLQWSSQWHDDGSHEHQFNTLIDAITITQKSQPTSPASDENTSPEELSQNYRIQPFTSSSHLLIDTQQRATLTLNGKVTTSDATAIDEDTTEPHWENTTNNRWDMRVENVYLPALYHIIHTFSDALHIQENTTEVWEELETAAYVNTFFSLLEYGLTFAMELEETAIEYPDNPLLYFSIDFTLPHNDSQQPLTLIDLYFTLQGVFHLSVDNDWLNTYSEQSSEIQELLTTLRSLNILRPDPEQPNASILHLSMQNGTWLIHDQPLLDIVETLPF